MSFFLAHRYLDRNEAGRVLAEHLEAYANRSDVVVLGLARGGLPVAAEVAAAIGAELEVLVVRKLGVPGQPELAMGAIAAGGVRVLNEDVINLAGISPTMLERATRLEQLELTRREQMYREGRDRIDLRNKVAILVDDGLATGSTMRAAIETVRRSHPRRVVVAVPVGAPDTCHALARAADEVICVEMPTPFSAVGLWYENFSQTSDDEVTALLNRQTKRRAELPPAATRSRHPPATDVQ